jgi:hypothetical protein
MTTGLGSIYNGGEVGQVGAKTVMRQSRVGAIENAVELMQVGAKNVWRRSRVNAKLPTS